MEEIRQLLAKKIAEVTSERFDSLAMEIFYYQSHYNPLYARYLELLHIKPKEIKQIADIPYLPIQFFKNHIIQTGQWAPQAIFSSSGTTGQITSQHYVQDLDFYLQNTCRGFEYFYGDLRQYCVLALLPSYLERPGSSLVAMADYFIHQSQYPQSGFFLYNTEELIEILLNGEKNNIPTLLLGVTFALWDLAEQYPADLSDIIIMETGGMKGRRREIIRKELHEILCQSFNSKGIHSEYGMTELLSQAYSKGKGKFYPSPTMRVFSRQITDPLSPEEIGKTGVINIIDLANIDTISFIATDDLGKIYEDYSFEILGRLDNSDIRGCNLMVN